MRSTSEKEVHASFAKISFKRLRILLRCACTVAAHRHRVKAGHHGPQSGSPTHFYGTSISALRNLTTMYGTLIAMELFEQQVQSVQLRGHHVNHMKFKRKKPGKIFSWMRLLSEWIESTVNSQAFLILNSNFREDSNSFPLQSSTSCCLYLFCRKATKWQSQPTLSSQPIKWVFVRFFWGTN